MEKRQMEENEPSPEASNQQVNQVNRMMELERREDRKKGEHLEMMIKQTQRGAKKPKNLPLSKVFVEDKQSLLEINSKFLHPDPLEETQQKEDNPNKKIVLKSHTEVVQKVSMIDIKIDEPDGSKNNNGKSEVFTEGTHLKKRNDKEFKEKKLANMFESDQEEEESRNSEISEKDFLEKQNEKQERENQLKRQHAQKAMHEKVQNLLRQDKKMHESEDDLDEKEEEPLNSQDDISGIIMIF